MTCSFDGGWPGVPGYCLPDSHGVVSLSPHKCQGALFILDSGRLALINVFIWNTMTSDQRSDDDPSMDLELQCKKAETLKPVSDFFFFGTPDGMLTILGKGFLQVENRTVS